MLTCVHVFSLGNLHLLSQEILLLVAIFLLILPSERLSQETRLWAPLNVLFDLFDKQGSQNVLSPFWRFQNMQAVVNYRQKLASQVRLAWTPGHRLKYSHRWNKDSQRDVCHYWGTSLHSSHDACSTKGNYTLLKTTLRTAGFTNVSLPSIANEPADSPWSDSLGHNSIVLFSVYIAAESNMLEASCMGMSASCELPTVGANLFAKSF